MRSKLRKWRDISKFVIVFMMYCDITELEKDRFDMGLCWGSCEFMVLYQLRIVLELMGSYTIKKLMVQEGIIAMQVISPHTFLSSNSLTLRKRKACKLFPVVEQNIPLHEYTDHNCGRGVKSLPLGPRSSQFSRLKFFRGFFSTVRQMSGKVRSQPSPNIIWPSLSSILIHYGRQWHEMLTRPKTSNKQTNKTKEIKLQENVESYIMLSYRRYIIHLTYLAILNLDDWDGQDM